MFKMMWSTPPRSETPPISDPLSDLETQYAGIEGDRALEVSHVQLHVADLGATIEGLGHTPMIAHVRGCKSSVTVYANGGDVLAGEVSRRDAWSK